MFETPESDISMVIINEDVVRDKAPAEYIRSPRKKSSDSDDELGFEDQELTVRNI